MVPIEEKDHMLTALAREIDGIRAYCLRQRPDCMLVLGDRDEAFAGAIVATHLNIPLAHIHGGDASGPGVDESLRHAISKMANIHFPATKKSAARIMALGEEKWRVYVVGTPGLDMLGPKSRLSKRDTAFKLELDSQKSWISILMHPTAFDSTSLKVQIDSVLKAVARFPDHEKVVMYPNGDTGSDVFIRALKKLPTRYRVFKSLPRELYVSAVAHSDVLVGNSSSGIIELAFLGTPVVDVGNRQRGREHGTSVAHVSYNASEIERAIKKAFVMKKKNDGRPFASPYGSGQAGKKIAEILYRQLQNQKLLKKLPPGGK